MCSSSRLDLASRSKPFQSRKLHLERNIEAPKNGIFPRLRSQPEPAEVVRTRGFPLVRLRIPSNWLEFEGRSRADVGTSRKQQSSSHGSKSKWTRRACQKSIRRTDKNQHRIRISTHTSNAYKNSDEPSDKGKDYSQKQKPACPNERSHAEKMGAGHLIKESLWVTFTSVWGQDWELKKGASAYESILLAPLNPFWVSTVLWRSRAETGGAGNQLSLCCEQGSS